jgi:hypothetical protein
MRDNGRNRQRLPISQRGGSGATFGLFLNQEAFQPVDFPLCRRDGSYSSPSLPFGMKL